MAKLIAIGEALIDFIPIETNCRLKDVTTFKKMPGGAPANVAACVAKLGGESKFISKLGQDAFGDYLLDTLQSLNVSIEDVLRTNMANTGLAFVSIDENGERDFSFYRHPSADMLLDKTEINSNWFLENDILHFCSVDLIEAPVKYAHLQAIEYATNNKTLISFDPNVRLPLWDDTDKCRSTILNFIPFAHLLKISDDELSFITGIDNEEKALKSLFVGQVKMIIYTKGKKGVQVITRQNAVSVKGFSVKAIDTTGAGDSFIGSLIYQLLKKNITESTLDKISIEELQQMLQFSNACAAIVVSSKGVINNLPNIKQVEDFVKTLF